GGERREAVEAEAVAQQGGDPLVGLAGLAGKGGDRAGHRQRGRRRRSTRAAWPQVAVLQKRRVWPGVRSRKKRSHVAPAHSRTAACGSERVVAADHATASRALSGPSGARWSAHRPALRISWARPGCRASARLRASTLAAGARRPAASEAASPV